MLPSIKIIISWVIVLVSSSNINDFSTIWSLQYIINYRSIFTSNFWYYRWLKAGIGHNIFIIYFLISFIYQGLFTMSDLIVHILNPVSRIRRSFRNFIYIHFLSIRNYVNSPFRNLVLLLHRNFSILHLPYSPSHPTRLYIFIRPWIQWY